MCVLVHDLPLENIEPAAKYQDTVDAFRVKQPTTFQNASLVMVGGKLSEAEVELSEENQNALRDFVYEAATRPAPPSDFDRYQRVACTCLVSLWALFQWALVFLWALLVSLWELFLWALVSLWALLKSLWARIILSCRSWTGIIVWAIVTIVLIVLIFAIVLGTSDKAPVTIIVPWTNITKKVHSKLQEEYFNGTNGAQAG